MITNLVIPPFQLSSFTFGNENIGSSIIINEIYLREFGRDICIANKYSDLSYFLC
jgi:hypothetical protein